MIKRMKMFLWIVVGLLLACGGCSRPAPAHLTDAEMAEIRSWVNEFFLQFGRDDEAEDDEVVIQLAEKFRDLIASREVLVEDVCYAVRTKVDGGEDSLGRQMVVLWLDKEPFLGLEFEVDRARGVIVSVKVDSGRE